MSLNKEWRGSPLGAWIFLGVVIAGLILIFIVLPLYSNFQVCKQYYSKVSPLVCMMSTKTKFTGDKE